eukprot:216534_1
MHGSEEMDGWMERKTDFYYAMPPPNTLKMSHRLTYSYLLSLIIFPMRWIITRVQGAGCNQARDTGIACHVTDPFVWSIQFNFISFNPISFNTIQYNPSAYRAKEDNACMQDDG